MELLGAYSDDSDTDDALGKASITAPVPKAPIQSTAPTRKSADHSKKPLRKKKKKLDISFLPENIQTALARGDTNRDSDSDGEITGTTNSISRSRPTTQSNVPALLAMLPKPKNDSPIKFSEPVVDKQMDKEVKVEPVKTEENVTVEDVDSNSDSDSDSSHSSNEDIGNVPASTIPSSSKPPVIPFGNPIPSNIASTSSISSSSSSSSYQGPSSEPVFRKPQSAAPSLTHSLPSFSTAPSVQSTIHTAPSTVPHIPAYVHSTSQPSAAPHATTTSSAPPQAHAAPYTAPGATHAEYNYYGGAYLSGSTTSHPVSGAGGAGAGAASSRKKAANNRKRERDIENGLLQGDVSAVETLAGSVLEVRHPTEWDNTLYMQQQERQKELKSMMNFSEGGGDKMLAQPSKMQNKRHQINSLAFNAAESELELLEARGRQMKSKHETQAKYGW